MVSIIKNQLLKHLSRFTKNLSADKINLSAFKGEGELGNLELNETVLTDLLELPSWLRLQSAWCNKVAFRIQWTQLKKVPIVLSLDEVNIIVETCEELREMNLSSPATAAVPGKYSFIHKIIDGITVTVNAVNITFNSPAFTANVQISRILLESKNPKWKKGDLRTTRIKEPERGQLLIFKELEWQTVRIEAKSTIDKNLTPLRLLTNQARCRITIKKRLSDSFILGSRLVIILDDLLWVLTDSQLKAALTFLDSLAGLVQKATELTRRTKAARKIEELPEYRAHQAQQERMDNGNSSEAIRKLFTPWDVVETSYHFLSHQIVLHLCDDPGEGRSTHPNLKDGGALQVTLQHFQVDFYPYHMAIIDRKHWPRYRESSIPHVLWQEQALTSFRSKFLDLIDRNRAQHTPLSRVNKNVESPVTESSQPQSRRSSMLASPTTTDVKSFAIKQLNKMMTSCIIIRIEDFTVYKVTTSGKKQSLKEFITAQNKRKDGRGERDQMSLPPETKMVHAEFTYFYYPNDTPFPLPAPKFYVQVNPINIYFDLESCLWLNSFALNLYQSLQDSKQDMTDISNLTYIDVKIEAILPRLIFESYKDYIIQRDRPKSLTFEVTRATITNVRSLEQSSRADLAKCVDSFHMGSLFFGSDFPSRSEDFYIVTQKFLDHISTKDNIRTAYTELNASSIESLISQLSREFMWTEAKDVWCINLEPVWADFNGARALNKPVPFLDAVPITIWLHANMDPNSTIKQNKSYADIHALAHISNLVSVQLNHYQYLFLLRLAEDATELATFLLLDTNRITKQEHNSSLIVGALIPQLEVTFVMPSAYPGKESSGGDVESFAPESSFADDMDQKGGSMGTVWNSNLTISSVPPVPPMKTYAKSPTNVNFNVSNNINSIPSPAEKPPSQQVHYQEKVSPNETSPMILDSGKNPTLSNITNAGFSSMRKGFSSLMTSIDSALKPAIDASDASDTMSIRSDVSSDSENYIFLNMEQDSMQKADDMFIVPEFMSQNKGMVEIASEVIEEESTITSTSEHSLTSSCRRKDLVSVSTFKLTKVEFIQQSTGYSSAIKLQMGNISNEDCNAIPWDEFQSKFSSRSRAWSDNPSNSATTTQIKLRMDHDIVLPKNATVINRTNLKSLFKDFLEIRVCDVALNLSMSTVVGLADLAEDECIPIPIPIELSLNDIYVHLTEDRPPVNITSPGPVPIDLKIAEMFISRDLDGMFHIVPNAKTERQNSIINDENMLNQQINRQLRLDNDELRRRLLAFERISEENRMLRKAKEETEVLKSSLSKSQEDVARLLEEKRRLLDEVRKLQEQFMNDRRGQWTSKR